MNYNNNLIKAPVVMPADIAAVLGIDGTDLATLCVSDRINPWAKWKPIDYNTKGTLTEAMREAVNYGLVNIPTWISRYANNMTNFVFGISRESANHPSVGDLPVYWGYQHPKGGSNSPYRLSDFSNAAKTSGYYHDAQEPCGNSVSSEYTIDSNGNLTIAFRQGAIDDETIKLEELSIPGISSDSLGDMYFGVALYKQGTSPAVVYAGTRSTPISTQPFETSLAITGLSSSFNGTYAIFPFLSSIPITFTDSLGQTRGHFIALHTDVEVVGIGSTITRMDILGHSLSAYRDTSESTRNLFVNVSFQNNVLSPSLSATAVFNVYNSSNTVLATESISITVSYGNVYLLSTTINMGSLVNLNAAYSVQVVVTPTQGTNPVETSASVLVSDGPSPYA